MAHVIEVPGETNPLSPPNVLNALVLAASSTQQQVQTGTQQLQNWEKQALYHSFLQVGCQLRSMSNRGQEVTWDEL